MAASTENPPSFQSLILRLQAFWAGHGCVLLQPYDVEVGAGTFHPATALRSLGPEPWSVAYVEPCPRPTDGRYGENPNPLGLYYQFHALPNPSPKYVLDIYLRAPHSLGTEPPDPSPRSAHVPRHQPTLRAPLLPSQ